ncbi:hypothetical protein [Bradyrhizobium elkanii]|uniref:hypothetical protein n=1 Tax=Bradyrhizobium elkanii TaxID=29448 RepID=UPI0004AFBAF5|nr:hypothetical protein [Bradyrhizobium elkanii]
MPIDLAGISNVNEFFSEHYLQTVFEGDVQELFREWRDLEKTGTTPPNRLLEKVGSKWRKLALEYRSERNERERLLSFRRFAHDFLAALGYDRNFRLLWDGEEKLIPVEAIRVDASGHDRVWIVEAVAPAGADFNADPLTTRFRCEQFENIDAAADIGKRRKDTPEAALNKGIFALRHPPRFVIIMSMSQVVLVDREKWSDSRLLRFDLADLFGRNEPTTLGTVAALLHANSLAPETGTALLDRIDEESHRHAYGVSQDLKFALRKAIELLGNEAAELIVEKRRAQQKGVFTGAHALDAGILSTECLRYMYRLLFLFYIEARPDLGFAPINAAAYASGYSLNSLRELELTPLETDEDRGGHFISDTIDTLFRVVFEGTPAATTTADWQAEPFTFHPVRARLFSPEAIGAYLGGLRFRNSVMQQIIELLSLSREGKGRGRGRISYAQLGISQLGAVYESLLSFTGFFADEELIEVKPAGKGAPGPLEAAYFTPYARAKEFEKDEIVYENASPKVYRRGTFIYRLAGRNRENSASYYTPEPLARMLVKYALKDLLAGRKKAADILKLKVLEPAMGSAAFLVEVVNQLADKYLELKQAELGRRIPHEERSDAERKVRAYIADRNVFGVDLNPIAVELGQISLWLDCLHKGGFAPWFEDQLHSGNSLVGARRAAHPTGSLMAGRDEDRWYNRKPHEIGWSGEARNQDEIWHFLLPDPGMSDYDQNIVRPLAPEAWKELQEWRKEFMQPFDKVEIENLRRISAVVDRLFVDVADRLTDVRSSVNDDVAIWPAVATSSERHMDFSEKMKRLATFHGEGVRNAVAWKRLKTAMDAWCALWFWPVSEAHLLPARATFIADLALVLEGKMGGQVALPARDAASIEQGRLFETVTVPAKKGAGTLFSVEDRTPIEGRKNLFGDVDVEALIASSSWLPTAMNVAAKQRFTHFDLEFADILRERGGFDLVVGNPPWLKPMWRDEVALASDYPEVSIRGMTAAEIDELKTAKLEQIKRSDYLQQHAAVSGLQSFLSNPRNFPVADGTVNLYQSFIDLAFRVVAPAGTVALIHQDSHLTEGRNESLRRACLDRLRYQFVFRNEIPSKLFAEVNHTEVFSLNIYGPRQASASFKHLSGLFLSSMVDACFEHDGVGDLPGVKHGDTWDTRPHAKRIVEVDESVLRVMRRFSSQESQDEGERFAYIHSQQTLSLLEALGAREKVGESLRGRYLASPMWGEADVTKKRKIMSLKSAFVSDARELVIKSPCIYVGNPFYKTAERICTAKDHFEEIDLPSIGEDYRPRSNFKLDEDAEKVFSLTPSVPWSFEKHAERYRIAYRRMVQPARERTLAAAIIPPGWQHVETMMSMSFEDDSELIRLFPLLISLPLDFVVKTLQIQDIRDHAVQRLPFAAVPEAAVHRALKLVCLTGEFAPLWNDFGCKLNPIGWSSDDQRLDAGRATDTERWSMSTAFRSDYERRMALVEIDVLVAMALGLERDHLIEMYRTQFPVLAENEQGTWYDASGRIVWTCSKGLTGVGFRKEDGKKPTAKEWEDRYADLAGGRELNCDVEMDYLPGGPRRISRAFVAPFERCNREADYRRAWAYFEAQATRKVA